MFTIRIGSTLLLYMYLYFIIELYWYFLTILLLFYMFIIIRCYGFTTLFRVAWKRVWIVSPPEPDTSLGSERGVWKTRLFRCRGVEIEIRDRRSSTLLSRSPPKLWLQEVRKLPFITNRIRTLSTNSGQQPIIISKRGWKTKLFKTFPKTRSRSN